jgi:hypothetical protein
MKGAEDVQGKFKASPNLILSVLRVQQHLWNAYILMQEYFQNAPMILQQFYFLHEWINLFHKNIQE